MMGIAEWTCTVRGVGRKDGLGSQGELNILDGVSPPMFPS